MRKIKLTFKLQENSTNTFENVLGTLEQYHPMSFVVDEHGAGTAQKQARLQTSGYTLRVDEVAELGVFVEIQKLTDDPRVTSDLVQADMDRFLSNLGLRGEISRIAL